MKVVIRPAKQEDLGTLEKYLPAKNIPNFHQKKLAEQKVGDSLWLIAWLDNLPIGHLQIRWDGAKDKIIIKHIQNCAHFESMGVKEEFQRQGVGTTLIKYAENLVKKRGLKQVGLSVGANDNPHARKLYEKLHYKNWGLGEFITSWDIVDKNGKKNKEKEICIYLIKTL